MPKQSVVFWVENWSRREFEFWIKLWDMYCIKCTFDSRKKMVDFFIKIEFRKKTNKLIIYRTK